MKRIITLLSVAAVCATTVSAQFSKDPLTTFSGYPHFMQPEYTLGEAAKLCYEVEDDNDNRDKMMIVNSDFQIEKTITSNTAPITLTTKRYSNLQGVTVKAMEINREAMYDGADGGKELLTAYWERTYKTDLENVTPQTALEYMKGMYGEVTQEKRGNDYYYLLNEYYDQNQYGTKYPTRYGKLVMTSQTRGDLMFVDCQYGQCPTFTLQGATAYCSEREGMSPIVVNGVQCFYPNEHEIYNYYMYDMFKNKYPTRYYELSADGVLYRYQVSYSAQATTGDSWTLESTEEESYMPHMVELYAYFAKLGSVDSDGFYLSQTLFNKDAAYEYVLPVTETYTEVRNDYGYLDGVGEYQVKIEEQRICHTGYKVMDENGKEVARLTLPSQYMGDNYSIDIFDFGDKRYMTLDARKRSDNENYEYVGLVYSINPAASGAMELVMEQKGMRVNPRVARRSTPINVEFGSEGKNARQVVVTSVNGVTAMTKSVGAGESSTSIDTSRLQPGMYVVSVVENGKKSEHCKVVIR